MFKRGLIAIAAASMVAGGAVVAPPVAQAQIPAFLPDKDSVPASEPMAIDGDWRVNTINKIIRIDRGRAYAVEGWTHAFVLRVQPDMVTIRDIRQTSDGEYVGNDLPLAGRVTMRVVSPDLIEASVPGLFGPMRYTLTRVSAAGDAWQDDQPSLTQAPDYAAPAQDGLPIGSTPQFASLTQAFGELRPVAEAFRGCAIPENAGQQRARSEQPASPRDRITDRQFAPVATNGDGAGAADIDDPCWTRIDGVWLENREPVFDTSRNDGKEWDVRGLRAAGLLHGNYTTPETLFIAPGDDAENEFWVMSGTNDVRFWHYVSSDGLAIADLIAQPGLAKTFSAAEQSPYGDSVTVDFTAGGKLRIRMGQRQFQRPEAMTNGDVAIDDVFALDKQTDNFAANLKGYNILTQDPFLLMSNDLGKVFARRGRDEYRFQEKYSVPFGFTLKNELQQGNVYRQTLNASEREQQQSAADAFGVHAKISTSGAVNTVLSFIPGAGQVADTGYSAGYQSTRETMRAMREAHSVGQVVGYSRAKSYAIVLDHATARLSGDFLTAIADAQRDGDYQYLIQRFGTHYPYAVTYGSAAKMWKDISEDAFSAALSQAEGKRYEAEIEVIGSGIGGFKENLNGKIDQSSGRVSNEAGYFFAVGGNGSWDSGAYSRGDRVAPILLDLRPLDELLNPINFPDQPDIYTRVRAELGQAVNRYLASQAKPLSQDRLLSSVAYVPAPPEPEPEPLGPPPEKEQEWHVYIKSIDCIKAAFDGKFGVEGTVSIEATNGMMENAQTRRLEASCKKKSTTRSAYHYNARTQQEGLLILRGTPSDLRDRNIRVTYKWDYVPGWKKTETKLDIPLRDYLALAAGKYREIRKKVTMKNNPDLSLQVRVRRVR